MMKSVVFFFIKKKPPVKRHTLIKDDNFYIHMICRKISSKKRGLFYKTLLLYTM